MGIFSELIGDIAKTRIEEHRERAQQQIQRANLLKQIMDGSPDPQQRALAQMFYMEDLTKYGGRRAREIAPQLNAKLNQANAWKSMQTLAAGMMLPQLQQANTRAGAALMTPAGGGPAPATAGGAAPSALAGGGGTAAPSTLAGGADDDGVGNTLAHKASKGYRIVLIWPRVFYIPLLATVKGTTKPSLS